MSRPLALPGVAPAAVLSLLRALLREDVLRDAAVPSLPWSELHASLFPGVEESAALAFARALQRALARAAVEQWPGARLGEYVASAGLPAAAADAAATWWAAEGPRAIEALSRRGDGGRALVAPPSFAALSFTAASGETASEAAALLALQVSDGGDGVRTLHVAATRGALAAALASIGQARRALGATA
jgi:hypothetical protein